MDPQSDFHISKGVSGGQFPPKSLTCPVYTPGSPDKPYISPMINK